VNEPDNIEEDDTVLVDKGMANLPRNDQGEVDQAALVDYIAARVAFDERAERRRKALRIIAGRRKAGATHADGQLNLPGVDPYDYEPDRLVLDRKVGSAVSMTANFHRPQPATVHVVDGSAWLSVTDDHLDRLAIHFHDLDAMRDWLREAYMASSPVKAEQAAARIAEALS
jgi:hypothetical protein